MYLGETWGHLQQTHCSAQAQALAVPSTLLLVFALILRATRNKKRPLQPIPDRPSETRDAIGERRANLDARVLFFPFELRPHFPDYSVLGVPLVVSSTITTLATTWFHSSNRLDVPTAKNQSRSLYCSTKVAAVTLSINWTSRVTRRTADPGAYYSLPKPKPRYHIGSISIGIGPRNRNEPFLLRILALPACVPACQACRLPQPGDPSRRTRLI